MAARIATATLLGILSNIKRPKRFLLETFFTREQTFTTEEVYFDKITGTRRLAPFVSPLVKGKPLPRGGDTLVSFKPPYLKPKHALTPGMAIRTLPGEIIQGDLSPSQRLARIRAQLLQDQDDAIVRREEWMASQLLRTGTLTVTAEDHPPMVINLGRPAGHTVQLLTTDRWGEAGVSPFKNLRTWATTVANASGVAPTRVIMDPLAANLFLADAYVQSMLNIQNYVPPNTIKLIGELAIPDEAQFLGAFGGFEYYQYQSTYWDADGTVRQFMPAYTVIMGSVSGAEGVRAYGAIHEVSNMVAASRYPKEWEEEDPSILWLMTQSAPLPLLGLPEATFCATVR